MPRTGRSNDFLAQYRILEDRVRRLELRQQGAAGQVESFIMDPITVRAWPPALAADMRLTGVLLWFESGSGIHVSFNAVVAGSSIELHSFTSVGAGSVHSAVGADMDYGGELNLEIGDWFYPEITAGSGSNIVAAFITNPG